MGVEAAEAAFFGSPEFVQWAVAKYTAIQQEKAAEADREAVASNITSPNGAGGGGPGAGGIEASRTSTVEALAGGGATAAERDVAEDVTQAVT